MVCSLPVCHARAVDGELTELVEGTSGVGERRFLISVEEEEGKCLDSGGDYLQDAEDGQEGIPSRLSDGL